MFLNFTFLILYEPCLFLTGRYFTRSERADYLGVERVIDAAEASSTSGDPCQHAGTIGAGQGIVLECVATPGEGREGASPPSVVTERHLVGTESAGRHRRTRVSPGMSSLGYCLLPCSITHFFLLGAHPRQDVAAQISLKNKRLSSAILLAAAIVPNVSVMSFSRLCLGFPRLLLPATIITNYACLIKAID